MNNKRFRIALMIPLLAGVLFPQAMNKQALLMALQANGKQMTVFQWKQKITVYRKGMALDPIIEEVRFNAVGQPQRTTLVRPQERKMGPLKAKKAEQVKDSIQDVMRLAGRYTHPQQLAQAIQQGEIWEGQGVLRVQARSLIMPLDEMTMTVNPATYLATRIDFKTQYEGEPVSIAADYQQMPGGPSMLTRMTVQIPGESVVVNTESYDFMRLAAPGGF